MDSGFIFSVAPRAGAWIETSGNPLPPNITAGRAPCGRVD